MCPLILVICFKLPVCPSGLGWNHQQYPPSALFMWTMTSTELRARCWDKGSRQTGLWQRSRGENMVDGAIWPALLRPRSAEHKAGATCLVCCAIQQKLSTTRIVRQDNVCVCVCVCVCLCVCPHFTTCCFIGNIHRQGRRISPERAAVCLQVCVVSKKSYHTLIHSPTLF